MDNQNSHSNRNTKKCFEENLFLKKPNPILKLFPVQNKEREFLWDFNI